MAIVVVNHAATPTGASSGINEAGGFVKPTAGNLLCCILDQTSSALAPTVKDNIGAWTVEATSSENNTASNTSWFAWKKATGEEKEISATPGELGSVQGIIYLEASGANTTAPVEQILVSGKQPTSTEHATPEITAPAGSLVFAELGDGASAMTLESWLGGMSNVTAAACRGPGGYIVNAEAVTKAVYTAKLSASKVVGVMAVVIKPAAAGGATIPLNAASSSSSASLALSAATAIPLAAASSSSAAVGQVTTPAPQIPLAPAVSSSSAILEAPVSAIGHDVVSTGEPTWANGGTELAIRFTATKTTTLSRLRFRTAAGNTDPIKAVHLGVASVVAGTPPKPGTVLGKAAYIPPAEKVPDESWIGVDVAIPVTEGVEYFLVVVAEAPGTSKLRFRAGEAGGAIELGALTNVTDVVEQASWTEWNFGPIAFQGLESDRGLTAATAAPLQPAASSSSASAGTITAPTTIPLQAAASVSSAQGDLIQIVGLIPVQPASSSSAASAGVTAPTTVPLQPAASASSARLTSLSAGVSSADTLAMLL